jgi:DNA repair exonuclease SbcCD ATPase subunit
MTEKYTYYFETTSRLEENCAIAAGLKKKLEATNNYAWKALDEIQTVAEALGSLNPEQKASIQVSKALEEVTEQHQTLSNQCIRELAAVSHTLANDLDLIKQMLQDKDYFQFHDDLKSIGNMVISEFRKPPTELNEAEELQQIMKRFSSDFGLTG